MKIRTLRLALAACALAAAAAPVTQSANAVECARPVMSTVCWAWGTACQYVPHGDGHLDPNFLLCTVAA